MTDIFHSFMTHANARGGKSSALQSLQWAIGITLSAIPLCLLTDSPHWLLIFIAAITAILVLTYIGAYIFLLLKDPDALRSETFKLSK